MNKLIITILAILATVTSIYATHNRAGEIVYKKISDFTYEITIYTYCYTLSDADRDSLEIFWGDNSTSWVRRIQKTELPDYYRQNIYRGVHTYPGVGTYQIVMEDPNRNLGINNIPNSVNVVFALKTILQINSIIGGNTTPTLLNMPIDKAAVGVVFIHNPNAFDPDGDSLSYKMAVCLYEGGAPIPNFILPPATNSITVDPISGDLIWDAPPVVGKYNVAMEIEEWRNGVKISSIIRDIQIDVEDTENHPPDIFPIGNICVVVDSLLQFDVYAEDPDFENLKLTAQGGVFQLQNPAQFPQPVYGMGSVTGHFSWQTRCEHVRKSNYNVIFKVEDDNPDLKLFDYENVSIRIIGPPPIIDHLMPSNASILVVWNRYHCPQISKYVLYRSQSIDNFIPEFCETGLPASAGYTKIAEINGWSDTTYFDNNNNLGLKQGYVYCYRLVAVFPDGAQSIVSERFCAQLLRNTPLITKASVEQTGTGNGIVRVEWIKARDLDTIVMPGPYRYQIFKADNLIGINFTDPVVIDGLDSHLYVFDGLNTVKDGHLFRIVFLNYDSLSNRWEMIGTPEVASSIFLTKTIGDRKINLTMNHNIPWTNFQYTIYRKEHETAEFDSIGYSTSDNYSDRTVTNYKTYYYKVKGWGTYGIEDLMDTLINFSQIISAMSYDSVAPCPPVLDVISYCEPGFNSLKWKDDPGECGQEIKLYKIFYSNSLDGELQLIETIHNAHIDTFAHYPTISLAGCYAITAVDSAGNESVFSQKVCVDNCNYYSLPNAFTPNGDLYNELYHPYPYRFVEKVDMKIYNRWGNLVFETADPDLNWDGKDKSSGNLVSAGVYYYICDVYEYRLGGVKVRNLSGFIHVFSNSQNKKP